MEEDSSDRLQFSALNWIMLITLALIWGSSYILIKYALKTFEPLQLGSLRVFIAFLALAPLLFFKSLKNFGGKQWLPVAMVGLFGSAIPAVLFAIAQTEIDSSLAAILNSLVPLSTFVIGGMFFGQRFTLSKTAGVTLGIIGSAAIILSRINGMFDGKNVYALLVIVAGMCYALQTNILKRYLGSASAMGITAWSFAIIAPLSGMLVVTSGAPSVITSIPGAWKALGFVALLGTVATGAAIVIFNKLIQQTTPLFASSVTYLIPFVAILWGLNDGENLGMTDFAGLGLILGGIYLTGK